jgi:hypothetical protein
MVLDWKKEVKPKLEKITVEEGGELTERIIDFNASKTMLCLTCHNQLYSTRAFTLPTEDKELFRWLCEACGDNIINYYQQLHGLEGAERKIMKLRRFDIKRGDFGTWKLEVCFGFFGKRYCTNCVYDTQIDLMKGKVVPMGQTKFTEEDENEKFEKDYKDIIMTVKLLESDWANTDPRLYTNVSYLCKDCGKNFSKDLEDSFDDIIGFESNVMSQQEMENKVEQLINRKFF